MEAALIIRLFGLTLEDLCFLSLGPLNEKGVPWEGWKAYGVAELLIKCMDQGKRVFLAAVSGTEAVEGGMVSYTNSEQTMFSQFHGKGLFLKGLVALISYPSPMQGKVKHELRDREPVSSILFDLRYDATMSASESHCHDVPVPVSAVWCTEKPDLQGVQGSIPCIKASECSKGLPNLVC